MNKVFLVLSVMFLIAGILVVPAACYFAPMLSIAEGYALFIGCMFVAAGSFLLSEQ